MIRNHRIYAQATFGAGTNTRLLASEAAGGGAVLVLQGGGGECGGDGAQSHDSPAWAQPTVAPGM